MPVQSEVIACPAGRWTSIAQKMDRRQSLVVQCPECRTTTTKHVYTILNNGVVNSTITTNALRKMVRVGVGTLPATSSHAAVMPHGYETTLLEESLDNDRAALLDEETWGGLLQLPWSAYIIGDGLTNVDVAFAEESYTCYAVVLSTTQNVQTVSAPVGDAVPSGIWQSPDLSSGGSQFRLSKADGDLVIQEWFVWPVGSGTINVQVFQAFDDAPISEEDFYKPITVKMPGLSPHGKQAAMELLAAMREGQDDAELLPDNAEL